jgi:hypothetical protein
VASAILTFNPEADAENLTFEDLVAYDNDVILKLASRWVREQDPTELPPKHRRFLLYYWFAIDRFGATDRVRLPDCVVAAVRSKYPNEKGEAYLGYISVRWEDPDGQVPWGDGEMIL